MHPVRTRRKLIEVALPLDAINEASAREKSIRHGHPSTLHLWWARRPLAAARAVIFAQMVDDPSAYVDTLLSDPGLKRRAMKQLAKRKELWLNRKAQAQAVGDESLDPGPEPTLEECAEDLERERLFAIIRDLVTWENTTNAEVLEKARAEIWQSWRRACADNAGHPQVKEQFDRNRLPAFHDPFAGGGALPLEAQRLGLEAWASDLNPVAVLINKAMIEIPPKFAGRPPVNPKAQEDRTLVARTWKGAQGLADDVRYYGQWMRDEAEKRIGHLYPKVEVTAEMVRERPDLKPYLGRNLTVIAWLWARTVKSPNPAFADVDVPLASSFVLSSKAGKEAYVQPVIENGGYRFTVKIGPPPAGAKDGTKLGRGANFRCVMSDAPLTPDYIKAEGTAGRMGARLMAIVAEGDRGRVYLPPLETHEAAAAKAKPEWRPETPLPDDPRNFWTVQYGLKTFGDLFTDRQLVALTTFSDLVQEAREKVLHDALGARASRPRHTWHSRGRLPHWEAGEVPQHIVFRLHDTLPAGLLERWREELADLPEVEQARERRQRIEAALDSGQGACHLRNPAVAEMVQSALLHFDGERYALHGWVVMPNHVHVLVTPLHGNSLSSILHSWKSFSAKEANRILGRTGPFWSEEYFDRVIRNDRHYGAALAYIERNPVAAGLCARAEDWPFGHAAEGMDERRAGRPPSRDSLSLEEGGDGAQAYADAVAILLGIALSRLTDISNSLCRWEVTKTQVRNLFGRQAIPMMWDFAENNVFGEAAGDYTVSLGNMAKAVDNLPSGIPGMVAHCDAQTQGFSKTKVVSTDPPYYDNIGYADLSDFFYVWLRKSLKNISLTLFSTLGVPKNEELVATPYRHGGVEPAESFFLTGMTRAMGRLAQQAHAAFPVTIYYAFKQAETQTDEGTSSTGWETFLDAVIRAGFGLSGTWPMRTELGNRMIGAGTNALASSIVLVCRPRPADARTVSRREFLNVLKAELPAAIAHLQQGNIAPVDLAQAAIGPGMAVYTRFAKVLDAEGRPLTVREALALINAELDEVLARQDSDFDADTRWALTWFDQIGFEEGEYGTADVLSKAKGTSVTGLAQAGIIASRGGRVRLLKPAALNPAWDPAADARLTVWEMVHHLIRTLESGGESAAASLLAKLGTKGEIARELAYRLYAVAERRKRAGEALAYNGLVQSWPEIARLALEGGTAGAAPVEPDLLTGL